MDHRALAALAVSPTTSLASGVKEEATRQLDFARAEISEGDFERALQSADSALRLEAPAHEVFLLKGLAYEGLGQLHWAEAMLMAHIVALAGLEPTAEATAALQRADPEARAVSA